MHEHIYTVTMVVFS